MSKRYPGGYLTASPVTPTASTAPGVWTLEQQYQAQGAGNWPAAANYQINKSLRFRSSASAYLNRTNSTTGTGATKIWTLSLWCKRGNLGAESDLLSPYYGGDGVQEAQIKFNSSDYLQAYDSGGSVNYFNYITTQVFRDPSAWYHIVIACDTTQATASDRLKIYVNGVQVTSFSTAQTASQNGNTGYGGTSATYIGCYARATGSNNFDGEMAEYYFIDGTQLTPSSFGTTDAYGIWQPIPYAGAYGTNGFYLPFTAASSSYAGNFSGSSQWVSVPNLAAFSVGTSDYTVEGWFYINSLGSTLGLFGCDNGAGSTPKFMGLAYTNGSIGLEFTNTGGTTFLTSSAGAVTTGKWYHIAWVRSSGVSTIYVNGVSYGSTSTSVNLAGLTQAWNIGYIGEAGPSSMNGQISNFRMVAGTAVYTTTFTPPTSALTAISGTQILTLQNSTLIDNSSNAATVTNTGGVTLSAANPFLYSVTSDASGNGNNWTPNNISLTSGTTYDSMYDSPTNASSTVANYAVLNPLDYGTSGGGSVNTGNLGLSSTSGNNSVRSTIQLSTNGAKWYAEAVTNTATSASNGFAWGFASPTATLGTVPATSGRYLIYADSSGYIYNQTSTITSSLGLFPAGTVLQIAFDSSSGSAWVGKNNTWYDSSGGTTGNPSTGTNPTFIISGSLFACMLCAGSSQSGYANFGQQPFTYTAPTGFLPLNTYNLSDSNVQVGNRAMDVTTWTGTSTSSGRTFTGINFQPDFVWGKLRSAGGSHQLYDAVRGTGKKLSSNLTDAEATNPANGYVSAFNSDGFTTVAGSTNNGWWNELNSTYVAWSWNAGSGTSSSNTNGSITSTVSVNPTAGFSVVTWSGNSTIGATVGHGLGVAPSMIIVKQRNGAESWPVYHTSLGATKYIDLNGTAAAATSISRWNNTSPSSSVITLYNDSATNGSGSNYVAYCFAPVAGYSAFGSYTGNGSSDGPFVYLGFRPRYIMIKSTVETSNWFVYDTARDTYNTMDSLLFPSDSGAEYTDTGYALDALSNGFKIRATGTYGGYNNNGNAYIYACFAENPFKMARAR